MKSIIIASLFLVSLAVLAAIYEIYKWVFWGYSAMSLIAFVVYAIDKSAARKEKSRVRERTLHLLAVFGAWPGCLIAQQLLRHKTQKRSFRSTFWATVFVNLSMFAGGAYLYWWHLHPS